ncbi:hypothetical protein ACFX1Z_018252 [Malus domestica]
MKVGRHMLSGEGGTASSPRFKSKRRSDGPDIFKVLKEEEIGQIKILEIEEASSKFEEAIQKSKRQAQKSEKHLAFPDASAPVTRKLSFAKITGNFSKRRSQISKRRQSFSATSAPITRKLSFAEITGTDCLEPFPDCLPSTALEYSSPTAAVLPKKLPHLPEE